MWRAPEADGDGPGGHGGGGAGAGDGRPCFKRFRKAPLLPSSSQLGYLVEYQEAGFAQPLSKALQRERAAEEEDEARAHELFVDAGGAGGARKEGGRARAPQRNKR